MLIVVTVTVLFLFSSTVSLKFGFQSAGSSRKFGDSFASNVFFDTQNSLIYINGETNWSFWDRLFQSDDNFENYIQRDDLDCYMAIIRPSDPINRIRESSIVYTRRFGATVSDEICSAMAYLPLNQKNKFMTIGHTDEHGFLTSLRSIGTPASFIYGFLIGLDLDINQTHSDVQIEGRLEDVILLHDLYVQYPLSITGNPVRIDDDVKHIYLLSQIKLSTNLIPNQPLNSQLSNGYGLLMQRITKKTSDEIIYEVEQNKLLANLRGVQYESDIIQQTMKPSWSQLFYPKLSLNDISVEHNLLLSDSVYVPRSVDGKRMDGLFIVGSTDGYGEAFGRKKNENELQHHMEGFVSILNPETGDLESSTRIHVDDDEVIIRGICFEGFGKTDVQFIYVIGDTSGLLANDMTVGDLSRDINGNFSKHAFISKLDAFTLTVLWTRQVGGLEGTDITSSACAIAPNEEFVYMAGNVPTGERLRSKALTTVSAGKNDFFVASYDSSGNQVFLKQIGTSQDDNLAKGQSIVCDEDGNIIVFGSTYGSLMRWRGQDPGNGSDIFLLTVEKITGKTIGVAEFVQDEISLTILGSDIFGLTVGGFIASCIAIYIGFRVLYQRHRHLEHESSKNILRYIENFFDHRYDLHIRHSATDGIHGIYGPKRQLSHTFGDLLTGMKNSSSSSIGQNPHRNNSQDDLMSFEENRQSFVRDEDISICQSDIAADEDSHSSFSNILF